MYRVVLPQGAVIRRDVELASPVVGHAPCGSWVTVVAQAFSDFPADRAVARLRLAGDGGWISTRLNHLPPHDLPVVECVGVDDAFDPEQPALFHLLAQQQTLELQRQAQEDNNERNPNGTTANQSNGGGGIEILEQSEQQQHDNDSNKITSHHHDASPSSSSSPAESIHPAQKPCLCCMENPRDATLVHGGTGHIVCCLSCARILQAQGQSCPVCRLDIDLVIKHYFG